MQRRAWMWMVGLSVATGCANPCEDDGLIQDQSNDCAADSAASAGETEGPIGIDSETESETASESDSANSNSASNSGTESDTDSSSDSETDSSSASDTDSSSASDTDSDTDSDSASDTDSSSDSDSDSDTAGSTPYCDDTDEDGFGDPDACVDVPDGETPPDGTVPDSGDCDDTNENTFPGAAENDSKDECMQDDDDDGWGDDDPPEGVTEGTDCDDVDTATFPGAAELDSMTECMQDEDEDGWGDDSPAEGVTAGSDCSDDGVDPCVVLITQDGTADNTYDQGLIAALQLDGYEVLNFADTDVVLADGNGVDVVVISETALSSEIGGTMADTTAPLVCLEGLVWDDMGMAPEGSTTNIDDVVILDDADPLAAGLTGNVTAVSGSGAGLFFVPAPAGATIVAGVAGSPDNVVEFAYESGASMLAGFVAPSRRVGLGYDADQSGAPAVTVEPDGIALFRAAVTWVTEG